jgi:hypothetical protein
MPPTKRARKRPVRKQRLLSIKLEAGKFYRALNGAEWCCFKVELDKPKHCQAWCIQVDGSIQVDGNRIQYFYRDGRYDEEGQREHTLIEEILPPHQQVVAHKPHLETLVKDGLNTCLKQIVDDPRLSKLVPVLFDGIFVFKFEGTANDVRTHLAYTFEHQHAEEPGYG